MRAASKPAGLGSLLCLARFHRIGFDPEPNIRPPDVTLAERRRIGVLLECQNSPASAQSCSVRPECLLRNIHGTTSSTQFTGCKNPRYQTYNEPQSLKAVLLVAGWTALLCSAPYLETVCSDSSPMTTYSRKWPHPQLIHFSYLDFSCLSTCQMAMDHLP